ncbi:MAG: hypothetical protein ACR2LQ_03275 [Acidimicrobiales bacterium]
MRVAVVGAGAVGARAARQLASFDGVDRVLVDEPDEHRREDLLNSLTDERAERCTGPLPGASGLRVAVLAATCGQHAPRAAALVAAGVHVVSVSDDIDDVRGLLALDAEARKRGVSVVVGAAFAPGLTCVLARHAASLFDEVDEIHVAKAGTGGPECARQHHRALARPAHDWRDGAWLDRPGGSGRELCWFPEPIGGVDCYRGELPDSLLLQPAFPAASRITARMGANRRDRLTARLPMLRRPHPEGVIGAVRVELRGTREGARAIEVIGVLDRPAVAAGAVAAVAAVAAGQGRLARHGAGGLAELVDSLAFLRELHQRGIKAATFTGTT